MQVVTEKRPLINDNEWFFVKKFGIIRIYV